MTESDWKVSATEGFSEPDKDKETLHYIEYSNLDEFPPDIEKDIHSWCIKNKEQIAQALIAERGKKITHLLYSEETTDTCYCAEGRILHEFGFVPVKTSNYGVSLRKIINNEIFDVSNYQSFPSHVIPALDLSKLFSEEEMEAYKIILLPSLKMRREFLDEVSKRLYAVIHEDDTTQQQAPEDLRGIASIAINRFAWEGKPFSAPLTLAVLNDRYLGQQESFKEIARLIRFFW